MGQGKYQVTVKEAAQYLDVSDRTIYNYLNENKLDAKKIKVEGKRKKWFINEDEFKEQAATIEEVAKIERQMGKTELKKAIEEAASKVLFKYLKMNDKSLQERVDDRLKKSTEQLKEYIGQLQNENKELRAELKEMRQENKELREQITYMTDKIMDKLAQLEQKHDENVIDRLKQIFG